MNLDQREHLRCSNLMARRGTVFVFGSNYLGVHGAGAAKVAAELYGATWGQGEGISGRSYALPTKDANLDTLPIEIIRAHVDDFKTFARLAPRVTFVVTRIGCGLAGYTDGDIAGMFRGAPPNCELPERWRGYNGEPE